MRDLAVQVQRVQNVSSIILFTFFNFSFAQYNDNDLLSEAEYEIINSIFVPSDKSSFLLYDTTNYDKTIAVFFQTGMFDKITGKVGIPTTITDDQLRRLLSEKVMTEIRSQIYLSKPLKLEKKKLNAGIKLSDSFDENTDLRNDVVRISEPIIIDDLALFRMVSFSESAIFILQKENGKWNIKYTFNDWLILE